MPKQLLVGYDAPAETLLAVLSAVVLTVALFGVWRLARGGSPVAASSAVAAGPGDSAQDATAGTAVAAGPGDSAQDATAGTAVAAGPGEGAQDARGATASVGAEDVRRALTDTLLLTGVAAAALALPALAALAGEDHLITRNLLAAAPLGCALAGAGLAAVAARRPGLGRSAIAAGCVLGLVAVIGVDVDPASRRDDWRGAVRALGHAPGLRIVVASPASGAVALEYYLPHARPLAVSGAAAQEIDYLAIGERRPGERPRPPRPPTAPAPVPGFVLAGRTEATTFTVLRLRAAAPPAGRAGRGRGRPGRQAAGPARSNPLDG